MSIGSETKDSHDARKTTLQLVKWTPCFTSCIQTDPSHIFFLAFSSPSKKSERYMYSSNSLQFIQSAIRLKIFKRFHFEVCITLQIEKGDGGDLAGPRPNAKEGLIHGCRGPYSTTSQRSSNLSHAAVQQLECKFSLGLTYYSPTC